MVTWLKRLGYRPGTKVIMIILFILSAFLVVNSAIGMQYIPKENSWYDTESVLEQLTYKAGFVRDWIVRYGDEKVFLPEKVNKEEIEAYRKNDSRIVSDEEAVAHIIRDRENYFNRIQEELVIDNVNIEFLAFDKKNDKIITNRKINAGIDRGILISEFKQRKGFLKGNGSHILEINTVENKTSKSILEKYSREHYYNGESFEEAQDFEIYVALKELLVKGDTFYTDRVAFENLLFIKNDFYEFGTIGIAGVFIFIIYWLKVVGQSEKGSAIRLSRIDRIPFEIHLLGYGALVLIINHGMASWLNSALLNGWLPYVSFYEKGISGYLQGELPLFLGVTAAAGVILGLSSLIKHIKNHSIQQYIATLRIGKWLFNNLITEKNVTWFVCLGIGSYIGLQLLGVWVYAASIIRWRGMNLSVLVGSAVMMGIHVAVGLGLFKITLDYVKLLKGSKAIAQGNIHAKIKLQYPLPVMQEMANTINHIGEGLEKEIQNSLKSERLKTELITNVSHDLKTPLTSIISYIDLLKEEEIENKEAKEYIQILDERSNRLKQLVEDLVDASKAITGNIKADLIPIELKQLVMQCAGEYMDRMEGNHLTIIMDKVSEVQVLADSSHMQRILDNLLSNVNKYAMPGTRVYLEVTGDDTIGQIVIKNISKEYLSIHPDELAERFVRGDKMRTTEGSGLGLAIVKSLVELQKGTFKSSIDGDLFKVEISIPRYN